MLSIIEEFNHVSGKRAAFSLGGINVQAIHDNEIVYSQPVTDLQTNSRTERVFRVNSWGDVEVTAFAPGSAVCRIKHEYLFDKNLRCGLPQAEYENALIHSSNINELASYAADYERRFAPRQNPSGPARQECSEQTAPERAEPGIAEVGAGLLRWFLADYIFEEVQANTKKRIVWIIISSVASLVFLFIGLRYSIGERRDMGFILESFVRIFFFIIAFCFFLLDLFLITGASTFLILLGLGFFVLFTVVAERNKRLFGFIAGLVFGGLFVGIGIAVKRSERLIKRLEKEDDERSLT